MNRLFPFVTSVKENDCFSFDAITGIEASEEKKRSQLQPNVDRVKHAILFEAVIADPLSSDPWGGSEFTSMIYP